MAEFQIPILEEVGAFLNSHYDDKPRAGPVVSELLKSYGRRGLEQFFGQFWCWVLVQNIPRCRVPFPLHSDAIEVFRMLFERSPELSKWFVLAGESMDFHKSVTLERRESLRSLLRRAHQPDVQEKIDPEPNLPRLQ